MPDRSKELAGLVHPEIRARYAAGAETLDDLFATPMQRCRMPAANDADLIADVVIEADRLLDCNAMPEAVDEASIEPFPASDPPTGIARRHNSRKSASE